MTPAVSVIMPVFNTAAYLAEAIQSVLDQTFTDFELIVIDDGSTDETGTVAREFNDPRLRLYRNPTNLGAAATANIALELARGDLIARMDGDDIALPERLALQAAFLAGHPDITVCGGAIELFEGASGVGGCPFTDDEIKAAFIVAAGNIMNPTTTFRRDFVMRHRIRYNPAHSVGEDLLFWVECARHGARFANLGQVLVRYRWHGGNASCVAALSPRIREQVMAEFYPDLTGREVAALAAIFARRPNLSADRLAAARAAAVKADSHTTSLYGENRDLMAGHIRAALSQCAAEP